ncbi:hypothetical protein SK128_010368, partial [Halocaridina rubra]
MIISSASSPPDEEISHTNEIRLSVDSSAAVTSEWLRRKGFQHLQGIFERYTGTDMLRLSKADLREICGLADGSRLYNAVQ